MKWNVEGADSATGADRVLPIEAETAKEAEQQARDLGLLVSAVHRARSEPASEAAVAQPSFDYASISTNRPPMIEYSDITTGARMLRIFASIATIVGSVILCIGVITGAVLAQQASARGATPSEMTAAGLTVLAPCLGSAFIAFVIAVSLKMYGSLALAVRDIARNSFSRIR